jgi:hypothetical protein
MLLKLYDRLALKLSGHYISVRVYSLIKVKDVFTRGQAQKDFFIFSRGLAVSQLLYNPNHLRDTKALHIHLWHYREQLN